MNGPTVMQRTNGSDAATPRAAGATSRSTVRYPIASFLPAMLQADDFCVRFTQGLDAVLAPAVTTIDNLDAYVDPWLTPPTFLDWLASWFGLELDATWPEERRRSLIANALELGRWRGTMIGLALLVELYTGSAGDVDDGGGVAYSDDPDALLPGEPRPTVVIRYADRGDIQPSRLARLVREIVPAHLAIDLGPLD